MIKRFALGLVALLLLSAPPVLAQGISQKVAVCNPAYTSRCITPAADGSIQVTGTVAPTGTQDVNQKQVNGATINVGAGAAGTGTQRVTTSTDSTIGTVTAVTSITNPVGVKGLDGSTIVGAGNVLPTRTPSVFTTLTTTPLLAGGTYTSTTIDTGASPSIYNTFQVIISSDQATAANAAFFRESDDGVTWYNVTGLNPITLVNQGASTAVQFAGRYHQIFVTNGAVNQTTFRVAYQLR